MKEQSLTIIIFGGTGDLAGRKLLPALFDLFSSKLLPDDFRIIGFGRKDLSDKQYHDFVRSALSKKEARGKAEFISHTFYHRGDLTHVEDLQSLAEHMGTFDARAGSCSNKLFHLAVQPELYEVAFKNLAASGMTVPCVSSKENERYWTRVLVEKPFGKDLKQARRLDVLLGSLFDESQIFRIDHYLAKEALQNILAFRFANAVFAPLWNAKHIEAVHIRIDEKLDVEGRGTSYDPIGALRDMGQNHLLQMLALVAMEDPGELSANAIRDARARVLAQTRADFSKPIVRAQYAGYKKEPGVSAHSHTETFFSLALAVKNHRWRGVPFYIESGKALHEARTEIEIIFKEVSSSLCLPGDDRNDTNRLIFSIQPEEKITVQLLMKKPGLSYELEEKALSYAYHAEGPRLRDAYEKVLYDCVRGDQTLFTNTDEVRSEWKIIMPILEHWQSVPLATYKKGSKVQDIIKKK